MSTKVDEFRNRVTIADGAWGTELDTLGCPPGYCREIWNIERPDLVERVARSYVEAGSRILLTNTFGGNRFVLGRHGLADKVGEFNRAGAAISRQAAGSGALVFGSIGPSSMMLLMGDVTEDELYEGFCEQAEALAEGGAEAIVVETMSDLIEATAAVRAAKTTGLVVAASMTFDAGPDHTRTMMGVTPEQAAAALTEAGADILGCNCGIGIDNYILVAGRYRSVTDKPIWVKANAGAPQMRGGRTVYTMSPESFAQKVKDLIAAGANIVGGCCGTSPAFIRAMVGSRYGMETIDRPASGAL